MISELQMGPSSFLLFADIRLWNGFVFSAEQTLLQQLLQPPDTSWNSGSHQLCWDVGQQWKEPPGNSWFGTVGNYFQQKNDIFYWYFFVGPKPDPFSYFSGFICKQFWVNFLKARRWLKEQQYFWSKKNYNSKNFGKKLNIITILIK